MFGLVLASISCSSRVGSLNEGEYLLDFLGARVLTFSSSPLSSSPVSLLLPSSSPLSPSIALSTARSLDCCDEISSSPLEMHSAGMLSAHCLSSRKGKSFTFVCLSDMSSDVECAADSLPRSAEVCLWALHDRSQILWMLICCRYFL